MSREPRLAPRAPVRRFRCPARCSNGAVVAFAFRPADRPGLRAGAWRGPAAAVRRPPCGGASFAGVMELYWPRPLPVSGLLRPADAAVLPPGTRSRRRRPRRTWRRRWCARPHATRRSRSWLRRREPASGSASSGRRWCRRPARALGTSSWPTPRWPRPGSACPSRQVQPPPRQRAQAALGVPSRWKYRPKAGRNRPKRPRKALSRSR